MPDLHSLPIGSRPSAAIRNNGPDHLVLERLKLRELAEGWPSYRQGDTITKRTTNDDMLLQRLLRVGKL